MKTILCLTCLAALTLIETGCYTPPPPSPPTAISVQPAAPPPPTGYVTYAPESYVWDGNEYVGVSNGQYVYWTGGAWIVAPPIVLGHFHGWERYHPDWRRHAMRYHHEPYR